MTLFPDVMNTANNMIGSYLSSVKVLEGGYTILYLENEYDQTPIKIWLSTPWRLESETSVVLAFDDESQTIIDGINRLVHIKLLRITISEKTGDLSLYLSNGMFFFCPVCRRGGDMWEIRLPSGERCGVDADFRVIRWTV